MSSPCLLKKQFEQSLKKRFDFSEISQKLITPRITHLAFLPEEVLDLSLHGFMPMVSLSPQQYVIKDIEVSMPLLRGKQIRWSMSWQGDETISILFIKLGTGGRINHCHLVLSIFEENQQHVATAYQQGTTVEDGQWNAFYLDAPLFPGKPYIGQLCSPDADNATHTLFLWVTIDYTKEIIFSTYNLIDLHHYGLVPITGEIPTDSFNRALEITFPILQGQVLQWSLKIERVSTSILYFKFGTGGKLNHCHLVFSIFSVEKDALVLVSTTNLPGYLAQDNHWTPLTLEHPLSWGHYICRLHSPDTDNTNHTLFVCLTAWGSENYCYLSSSPRKFGRQVPISIILPLHQIEVVNPYLRECLDSVVTQVYPYWELCIAMEVHTPLVETYQRNFPNQVKFVYGHRANLLNLALTIATGEYLTFLHPNDLLSPDALMEVTHHMTSETDMLYSDEDHVNHGGVYYGPYFKPQWAPEMLKGMFYTGQLGLYRTSVLNSIGGFREEFNTGQESPNYALWKAIGNFRDDPYAMQLWEMVLRFTQRTQHIQHLAKVLYHQRAQPSWLLRAPSCQVIQAALDQESYGGSVTLDHFHCLIHYPVRHAPLVSVIIPTRDQVSLLTHCLETFLQTTNYNNWELIIVDNGSQHLETFKRFEHYQTRLGHRFKVVHYDIPFNFSKLVNRGVKIAQGEIILLLNNDIEILGPSDWLEEMIGFAQHPQIACVGCKLLYPQDDTFQHAGLICGIGGIANPGHKHFPAQSSGYYNRLAIVANYSAITGACLMVKHTLWDEIGGFDEDFAMAFNDVDFCLKLCQKGFRHVVLPQIVFYHHESKSRGLENTWAKKKRLSQEEQRIKHRWGSLLQNDPFYNPHLTQAGEDFSLDRRSIYHCARKKNWIRRFLQI